MKEIDPDNLEVFHIPDSILQEIYELTGEFDSSKGFILACVGQEGKPFVYSRASSDVVLLGLHKALEEYLMSRGPDE